MEGVTCVDIERNGTNGSATDMLAVEEPLEIRVDGAPLSVTMREAAFAA